MSNNKYFGELISEKLRNQLLNTGVLFSEIRLNTKNAAELVEQIYRYWRTGSLKVKRNWSPTQIDVVPYQNSACLLPDDRLFLEEAEVKNSWNVATWNVNSIRTRLPLLLNWLAEKKLDVVCLQETKVENKQFPSWELRQAGYEVVIYGQKSYNGVAILSKHPIEDVQIGFKNGYDPENARLICGTVNGVRLVNVYVPQGQTTTSEKFSYKLHFLEQLVEELKTQLKDDQPFAIMGDFNIAPEAIDVINAELMRDQVSYHPLEHESLAKIMNLDLSDVFRKYDKSYGQYSWWDFRTQGFERGEGMRIDYILTNPLLDSNSIGCKIDIETRAMDKPSDHAAVIGEFKQML